ncbi:MAG TPA: hypothetical protein VF045_04755 [Acidimicrobiales bacterium]
MTSPLDRLLDVVFYAPLGLALRAAEELPNLAAQGRERIGSQSDLARMVGKMAVAQGRRRVDDLLERKPASPPGTDRAKPSAPTGPPTGPSPPSPPAADFVAPTSGAASPVADIRPDPPAAVPDVAPATDVSPAPHADDLPIPGYDSLSASQVVQRLAGLSTDELEAVRAYEQARRGRKTVLLRIAQLRAAS